MKKILSGLAVAFVVALMSLGFAPTAHAAYGDEGTQGADEDTLGSTVDSEAGTAATSGVLPATGGPETLLLVGGAALVAVGGVALVASRRRGSDAS